MPKFTPIEQTEEKERTSTDKSSVSDVQKAKDAAEIQKYETERIEAQKQAVFAENDIKSTEDLQAKIKDKNSGRVGTNKGYGKG